MKSNKGLAQQLWFLSELLRNKKQHSYQAKSFANASEYVSRVPKNLCAAELDIEELDRHKNIGPVIAKEILEYCSSGKILYLEDLLESTKPEIVLQLSRGIGKTRAQDIVQQLNVKSYFDLQSVMESGHLKRFLGSESRVYKDIEDLLLSLPGWLSEKRKAMAVLGSTPDMKKLLKFDQSFRRTNPFPGKKNALMELVEPEGFYKIFYSDSESATKKSGIGDWVVIKLSSKGFHIKWIALTSRFGSLKGKRIIAGHEKECKTIYDSLYDKRNEASIGAHYG